MVRTRLVLAAAAGAWVIVGGAGASAQNGRILDLLTSGAIGSTFWQGSWGVEGRTPLVTVAGVNVSYIGANGQPFAVSSVSISATRITFQVGAARVALVKRFDNNADMVSTIGDHSSDTIVLCRSDAPRCP